LESLGLSTSTESASFPYRLDSLGAEKDLELDRCLVRGCLDLLKDTHQQDGNVDMDVIEET
jgi:hypothetical protein